MADSDTSMKADLTAYGKKGKKLERKLRQRDSTTDTNAAVSTVVEAENMHIGTAEVATV
jgi:hypothetical protein